MNALPPLPDLAISARSLRKVYGRPGPNGAGSKVALSGMDLDIPRGSFFGLLGPNGAGKSTFINILAGLANKTAGTARIWDFDINDQPRRARSCIGVVPQELNLDPFFTPREVLEFQAGLYGVPKGERRTDEILAAMNLVPQANAYARTLSGGMRRRLLVGKALVHSPPVLVLDEPTAGVDIELRQQLWAYVRELNRQGTTIVLTTHYLEEAEQLCDCIAIINHGALVACDTKPALLARLDHKVLAITVAHDLAGVPAGLARFGAELKDGRRLLLHYRTRQVQVAEILAAVQAAGLHIVDLSTIEADLEDLFLELTRRSP